MESARAPEFGTRHDRSEPWSETDVMTQLLSPPSPRRHPTLDDAEPLALPAGLVDLLSPNPAEEPADARPGEPLRFTPSPPNAPPVTTRTRKKSRTKTTSPMPTPRRKRTTTSTTMRMKTTRTTTTKRKRRDEFEDDEDDFDDDDDEDDFDEDE